MAGEGHGQNAACPPEPAQFFGRGVHGVVDRVRLGEFLIERVFATCRQRQGNGRVSGEVTNQIEVIVAERRLLRVACHRDHTKHRVVRNQRHHDRRTFTDVGELLDWILEGISNQG